MKKYFILYYTARHVSVIILGVDRKELYRRICEPYCRFYKPRKDEDLACLGFLVIQHLIEEGKNFTPDKPERKSESGTEPILSEDLCIGCSYRINDCDFAAEVEGASPCGGFIFLRNLLRENILSLHELQRVVKEVLDAEKLKDLH